jgi:hypothetical protein
LWWATLVIPEPRGEGQRIESSSQAWATYQVQNQSELHRRLCVQNNQDLRL